MACKDCISASEFNVSGAIHNPTILKERGMEVRTDTVLYADIKAKHMNPLRTDTSEVYEFNQEVAAQKNSWLIRTVLSQTITANKMAFVENGNYHEIRGVRKYKGGRKYLVLDTILRDNQTDDFVAVATPTNLAVVPAYNAISFTVQDNTGGAVESYDLQRNTNGAGFVTIASAIDLTTYVDLLVGDDVKSLLYRTRANIGTLSSAWSSEIFYLTWALNPVLDINAADLSQYTLDGVAVVDYTSLDPDGVVMSQATPAQRPVVDSETVPTKITFSAATSDFLSNTADVEKLKSVSVGFIVYIAPSQATSQDIFSLAQSTTNSENITLGVSSGKANMFSASNVPNGFLNISSVESVSESDRIYWLFNGLTTECYINKTKATLTFNEIDQGFFLAQRLGADNISIGSRGRLSDHFSNLELTRLIIGRTILSVSELEELDDYITR